MATKKKVTSTSSSRKVSVKALVEKKAPAAKKTIKKEKKVKYYETVGRRKTATARIRLWIKGNKDFIVNKKPMEKYFPILPLQEIVLAALKEIKAQDKYGISVVVRGGGVFSQAEAVRHGIARVLTKMNPNFRLPLKKAGFLTRDPRMKERKKFGLKRARRAPQWRKR